MLAAELSDAAAADAPGGSLKSKLSVVVLCPHAHMENIRYRVTIISDFARALHKLPPCSLRRYRIVKIVFLASLI